MGGTRFGAGRPAPLGEAVVVLVLIRVYDWIRRLAATRAAAAEHHAMDLLRLERLLHADAEHPANRWLAAHPYAELLAGGWYQFAHIPVTIGVLGWCWWRRPAAYRAARTGLIAINLAGLAVFLAFPVMPPRLLSGAGYVDSVAAAGLGPAPTGPVPADAFAAMPSLHLAWATWVAVVLGTQLTGRLPRLVAAGYPLATAVVTVTTANHYVLDVLAGVVVAVTAAAGTGLLRRGAHDPPIGPGRVAWGPAGGAVPAGGPVRGTGWVRAAGAEPAVSAGPQAPGAGPRPGTRMAVRRPAPERRSLPAPGPPRARRPRRRRGAR